MRRGGGSGFEAGKGERGRKERKKGGVLREGEE